MGETIELTASDGCKLDADMADLAPGRTLRFFEEKLAA
jgi:hypothetical protein